MNRVLDYYCRVLEALSAFLLATMVVLVFGNVVLRYVFNTGLLVSEELSRWMFVWLVFMGAIVVIKDHGHMGTDMVVSRLPLWGKRLCLVVTQTQMIYITWLMFVGSWAQVKVNIETEAPVSGLSVSIFYFSGVVFAVSAGLMLIRELILSIRGKTAEKDLIMVQESEEGGHENLAIIVGSQATYVSEQKRK